MVAAAVVQPVRHESGDEAEGGSKSHKATVREIGGHAMKKIFRRLFARKKKGLDLLQDRFPQYEIGRGSYGPLRVRYTTDGATLKIGAFCSVARGALIALGGEHRTRWVTTYPFPSLWPQLAEKHSGWSKSKGDVIVGNDVWIGADALIMSGVRIGNGAVIGARSVVTKDVPPYAIVVGNPAKVIRLRFPETVIARLERIAWWDWDDSRIEELLPLLLSDEVERFLDAAENTARYAVSGEPEA
jgi:chloramphenicol O-acetyltransferase type B